VDVRDLVAVLESDLGRLAHAPPDATPWLTRRIRRAIGFLAAALTLAALGFLVSDQVQEHTRFDGVQSSLASTRHAAAAVAADLTSLRRDLSRVTSQLESDTTALNRDSAQLKGAETALLATQVHVTQQASRITTLHTCLSGVEQALNALAVNKQARALTVLGFVSSSCTAASASSG
jgi:septal ring factor EnvC (AmiA/AmiB activator)